MKHTVVTPQQCTHNAMDLLLIPVWEGEGVATHVPQELAQNFFHAQDLANDESFIGKWQHTFLVHSSDSEAAVRRVLFYGAGKKEQWSMERARRMVGAGAQYLQRMKLTRYGICCETLVLHEATVYEALSQALVESVLLATYQYAEFKTDREAHKKALTHLYMIAPSSQVSAVKKGAALGEIFARATMRARELINAPANHMTPTVLLKNAKALSAQNVSVKGYDRAMMKKMGMNTILAVASGSEQEPYLIHLRYVPKNKKASMKIALCGKGITFDSGGLQVKPGQHMDGMKYDMAAAGMVIGVFSVLAELQPNIEVHGVIAATENMASGNAMKPGDVVKSYSGKTIEIGHTDAEGRLVLADALAWAEDTIKPDVLIDAATLTGAAIYALGQEYAGIMGSDPTLVTSIKESARECDENLWELPLVPDYEVFLESKVADYTNLPPVNWAGTTLGAMFLQKFVDHTPWAHLDIAGPAWIDRVVKSYNPEGASGYGVRTFLHMILKYSGKKWK